MIEINEFDCGCSSCVFVDNNGMIIIESYWKENPSIIEEAMSGIISHETIEYVLTFRFEIEDSIHDLIGINQTIRDYCLNDNGIAGGDNISFN